MDSIGGSPTMGGVASVDGNNVARAIAQVATALANAFPQASSTVSHVATGGADTLPANPAGFLTITLAGVAYKIPLYK